MNERRIRKAFAQMMNDRPLTRREGRALLKRMRRTYGRLKRGLAEWMLRLDHQAQKKREA